MLKTSWTGEAEEVVVKIKGRVLDSARFTGREEAEAYKGHVRRWAAEKGIKVDIWSHGPAALRRAVSQARCVALARTA